MPIRNMIQFLVFICRSKAKVISHSKLTGALWQLDLQEHVLIKVKHLDCWHPFATRL